MYAEPRHRPSSSKRGCLPRTCSFGCGLPLVAVTLLCVLAATWYLQYSEFRLATSGRQPIAAANPELALPSPERHICREVRPQLTTLARRLGAASGSSLEPEASGSPFDVWVLLLDRTYVMDWLVVANPQGYMWLPMEAIVDQGDVQARLGQGPSDSATYMLGLVVYDAHTGQVTVDPQAFLVFVASSAVFRNCPSGTFAELRAATPSRPAAQTITPSDTSSASDDSAPAAVGWKETVNVASNLRTGPSTDFPVLRVLSEGTEVVVVGISEDGEWLKLEDGAWIFRSLVTREGSGATSGVSKAEDAGTDTFDEPVPETGLAPATDAAATEPIGNGPPDFRPEADRLAELRLHMLELINRERSSRGLAPVVLAYNEGAQLHAEDLVKNRYMSHWNLLGETPYMRHTWAGGHDYSAENLSFRMVLDAPAGFCASPASEQALDGMMAGLMDSPGHRDNILRPHHREVNIGIANSCHAMAMAQVFEGEYVRFSLPPELAGGRLAMAGQIASGVNLDDQTNIQITWDPPLNEYSKGQVSQTYCSGTERPVAYIRRPLSAGFFWQGGERQEMDWERCPAPWDADPNLQLPADRAEIDQLSQRIRNGYRIRETVEVALVTAEVWQAEAGFFRIEADLNSVVQTHGPGIYSVILWGRIDGVMEALTKYAIKVEG
ncbi:MAG: SH3 domain-containing protein [Caldilineaceae bacterium SB0662_bin_9]|uniref:SH3 domain-containing protein n=1 Tax=Caldilineaceae bacterium SB0662_bin_9 TaxID=2605258 RepID=A0A6B1DU57_9CHLR|nr:SH3 domain-containing protein [Caldilineaceae bacterium SB0662_bin_9]